MQRIKLLNLVSEIMGVWKTSRNMSNNVAEQFTDVTFVKLKN